MSVYLMLNFYLEVAHHDQTHGVGAARHQSTGVDPTMAAMFNHLGVAQKAHHHHCRTQESIHTHLEQQQHQIQIIV